MPGVKVTVELGATADTRELKWDMKFIPLWNITLHVRNENSIGNDGWINSLNVIRR
jgi:hypothetical protein